MPRIRSSCLSPKPETLNPETEIGTSGTGPGPGPLYTPPTTHECETEQTCGVLWANPMANSKAIPCANGDRTSRRERSNLAHVAALQYENSLFKLCGDQRPPTRRNRRFPGSTHPMNALNEPKCQTEDAPAAESLYKRFHDKKLRAYWLIVANPHQQSKLNQRSCKGIGSRLEASTRSLMPPA